MVISRSGERQLKVGTCKARVDETGDVDGRLTLTSERLIFERKTGGIFNKSFSNAFEIDLDLVTRVEVEGGLWSKGVRVQTSWTELELRSEYSGLYHDRMVRVDESGDEMVHRRHHNYVFKIQEAEVWESVIRTTVQDRVDSSHPPQ